MNFRHNKIPYRFIVNYYKSEDKFGVKFPDYYPSLYGSFNYKDEWYECSYFYRGSRILFVQQNFRYELEKKSDIEVLNNLGLIGEIKLSFINLFKIKVYFLLMKWYSLIFLKLRDKIKPIFSNIKYILFAIIGALIYYFVNYFFDDFLKNLINDSNFAQSVIVFLSLSSLINIVHPFTLRQELTKEDVSDIVKKRVKYFKEKYNIKEEDDNDYW